MSLLKPVSVTNILILLLLISTVPAWGLTKSDMEKYQREVDIANKKLPKNLNRDIQLTKVYMKDNTLVCEIKSIRNDIKQIKKSNQEKTAKITAARNLCSSKESLSRMKDGLIYKYLIHDKNGTYVYEYSVNEKDCASSSTPADKSTPSSPKPQKESSPPANKTPQVQSKNAGDSKVK
jgi:hypothetical protein